MVIVSTIGGEASPRSSQQKQITMKSPQKTVVNNQILTAQSPQSLVKSPQNIVVNSQMGVTVQSPQS